jgi:tRNA pseudouridine55 synthase
MATDIDGILLLDKPIGLSSAGAVARVKSLFEARKAGHTGSLDPLASGLLPVCLGEATKFGAQLLEADKTYRVMLRLGERTASADRESDVIETRELPRYSRDELLAALATFPRAYSQTPPMHSAIKQDGRPLYEYARAGIIRERAPREIVIHEMRFLGWQAPDLEFEVRCTKGAYIRVLAEDLAASLETIGHLAGLRRVGVAPFSAPPERFWSLDELQRMTLVERRARLLPVDAALSACRRLELPADGVGAFRQGRTIHVAAAETGMVRIYSEGLGFLGLGQIEAAGRLVPLRLIAAGTNRA